MKFCSLCGQTGYHLPKDVGYYFNDPYIPNNYTKINGSLVCQNCWQEIEKEQEK